MVIFQSQHPATATDEESDYVTLTEVAAICREVVTTKPRGGVGYEATFSQVFFFTLLRATKVMCRNWRAAQDKQADWWQSPDPCLRLPLTELRTIAQMVAQHLAEWGGVVHSLQQGDAKEWELLRIQMEQALKRFADDLASKDDALGEALLKLFAVLDAMPDSEHLETAPDLFAFFVAQQAALRGVYDFASPFYAYAQLIARNTLFYQRRRSRREPIYPIPWDELPTEPAAEDPDPFAAEEKARAEAAQRLQLRIDLARLFELIKTAMQPQKKRRLVVWHTLAARSQYWLVLAMTALPPPVPLSPTPQASDTDIASNLGMNENSVRVHRTQAKTQITELDTACGELLETLIDLDQSNHLHWWPQN